MEALRLIIESRNRQVVIDLPPSLEKCKLEVIIMPAETGVEPTVPKQRHKPSPMLAGSVRLKDDLIAPAFPEADWDALQ